MILFIIILFVPWCTIKEITFSSKNIRNIKPIDTVKLLCDELSEVCSLGWAQAES